MEPSFICEELHDTVWSTAFVCGLISLEVRRERSAFKMLIVKEINFLTHPPEINWKAFKYLTRVVGCCLAPDSKQASAWVAVGERPKHGTGTKCPSAAWKHLKFSELVLKKQNELGNVRSFLSPDVATQKELCRHEQTLLASNLGGGWISSLNSWRPKHLVPSNFSFLWSDYRDGGLFKNCLKLLSGCTFLFFSD